jgi:WD40 repeat protein
MVRDDKLRVLFNDKIWFWDSGTGNQPVFLEIKPISRVDCLAFSPKGDWLVSCTDSVTWLWRFEGNHKPLVLDANGAVAFSEDGRWLAIVRSGIKVWDLEKAQERRRFKGLDLRDLTWSHRGPADETQIAVKFDPSGKWLVGGTPREVVVWDVLDGETPVRLDGACLPVAVSADGKWLATGSSPSAGAPADTVKLWKLANKNVYEPQLLKGHKGGVSKLAFTSDSNTLVSASYDGTVRLWRVHDAKKAIAIVVPGARDWMAIPFGLHGKRVAIGLPDGTVRLWDIETGVEVLTLKSHGDPVVFIGFAVDGTRLVSLSSHGTVNVWEAPKAPAAVDFK